MGTFWETFRGFDKVSLDGKKLTLAINVVKLQKEISGEEVSEGVCEVLARKLLGDFMDQYPNGDNKELNKFISQKMVQL